MSNIDGTFTLDICGKDRELKCNFKVIDKLERQIFKRPITQVLGEACSLHIYQGELADTIHVALEANGGTSLKRDEIGEYVQRKGMDNYSEFYIRFLTYAITGEEKPEIEEVAEEDKKK